MKKCFFLFTNLFLISVLVSCHNKKLTEYVVEVPLPAAQEKIAIGNPDDIKVTDGAFLLEKLPFKYDALSPHLSAMTIETHFAKHYLAYTNNLNKAVAGTDLENLSIEEVLHKLDMNNAAVRNNAGGYYNHTLFFNCLATKAVAEPKDTLAGAINKNFGSFKSFSTLFKAEANKQFGSGWVWLVVDKMGKLQVTSSQNQDNPLMKNALIPGKPILALDLWEHAYYLDYQNRRGNYIDAYFKIINWDKVAENFEATFKK
jgi:superoxide dismutase, Fe-Mn family